MRPKNSCFAGCSLMLTLVVPLLLGACSSGSKPTPAEPQPQPQPDEPSPTPDQPPDSPADPPSDLLPLPSFKDCASKDPVVLPEKWEASALMESFYVDSLWFAKFVYDDGADAFRFTMDEQFGGAADYLTTTDGKLYLLKGADKEGLPTSCELMTSTSPFTVPSREWLSDQAVCVGEAPILKRDQRWWKNPSGAGANWFWFDTQSGLPFRSMYYADVEHDKPAPVYEHFTFNYFPEFKEVQETNLKRIHEMCKKRAKVAKATKEYAKFSIAPLLKRSASAKTAAAMAVAPVSARIKALVPGIKECASKSSLPPPWPEQLQVTAFMTAVSFAPNPFPTRIFYDWQKKSQNTTLYYYPPTPKEYAQTAYLLQDTGYITISGEGGGVSMCQQVLPGPPVPDWKKVDGCECRAELEPGSVLNPSDVTSKILWCPTDLDLKQVFWTWYSDEGEPVVFMQSNSSPTAGTGLNLADYHAWGPGSTAPPHTFDLPSACQGQPKKKDAFPKACNNCHLPVNPAR